jgi:predicted Zn-dependent peptidase
LRAEALPGPARPVEAPAVRPPDGIERSLRRPGEQAHAIIGCPGLTATDQRRHALSVLNAILGGGMSSRLFQEIRERRGLAYSTYSFAEAHSDAGAFGLYAGCAPAMLSEVVELLGAQWDRLAADGVTAGELARAKGQLAGGLVLGMEDTSSRMSRLGRAEIVTGELPSISDMLARIEAVTAEQVNALAADLAARPRSQVQITAS